jgi:hypothetical protein
MALVNSSQAHRPPVVTCRQVKNLLLVAFVERMQMGTQGLIKIVEVRIQFSDI